MAELQRAEILVAPASSQNRIEISDRGELRVAVTAPPAEGRANKAVIRLLADVLDVPVSAVEIVRGATGRRKLIAVAGMNGESIYRRLMEAARKAR